MCDAIDIGNTHQTQKQIISDHYPISYIYSRMKKNSFSAYFEQHFNFTTSRTDLRKHMIFKLVKQLNPIGTLKTFTNPNCNLCIEERLTILKKLRDKRVQMMNKNLKIYRACRYKTIFHRFY